MQIPVFKRGTLFKAALEFDEAEWAAIYPNDGVKAQVQQGHFRYDLAVAVDAGARTVTVSSETGAWLMEPFVFDLRIEKDGENLFIPAETNLSARIIGGVTE